MQVRENKVDALEMPSTEFITILLKEFLLLLIYEAERTQFDFQVLHVVLRFGK